ncbi:MAG: hypothetical protein QFX32_03490 [Methanolinea sp.]|nr:hypothetical protein [Methanolinea sp.]
MRGVAGVTNRVSITLVSVGVEVGRGGVVESPAWGLLTPFSRGGVMHPGKKVPSKRMTIRRLAVPAFLIWKRD